MRLELSINGMTAVHARHGVFTALSGVEGVLRAEVELGRVLIEVSDELRDIAALEVRLSAAVELVGYQVTEIRQSPRTLPLL